MAADLNQSSFTGNLASDPRIRQVKDFAVCDFTIAVNGLKEGATIFVQCSWWRPNKAIDYLGKGKKVAVTGPVKLSTWNSKTGEMKSAIGLDVKQLVLLGGRDKEKEAAPKGDAYEEDPFTSFANS